MNQPTSSGRRHPWRRRLSFVALALVGVLIVAGVGAFFAFKHNRATGASTRVSSSASSTSTPGANGATATTAPAASNQPSSTSSPSATPVWTTHIPPQFADARNQVAATKYCARQVQIFFNQKARPVLHQTVDAALHTHDAIVHGGLTAVTANLNYSLAKARALSPPACARPVISYYQAAIAWYHKGAVVLQTQGKAGLPAAHSDFHRGNQVAISLTAAYLRNTYHRYHIHFTPRTIMAILGL